MSEAEKFRAVLEEDPTDTQAFVGLCHIAEQDSDFEYLAELYKFRAQIIQDTHEIADLFFKSGEVYLDKIEDLNRGVECLLQGFEYDKTHAGIGDRLDIIYRENDDWESTAQILEQRIEALKEADQNGTKVVIRSDLHQQIGEIWEKVYNDLEKALKNYRTAIELDRTNLPALYSARELYYNSGKYKNAAKLCELEARAEKDNERRIALYRELARLLDEHLGDSNQAVLALKRALKLSPEDEETKVLLAKAIAKTPLSEETKKNHRWACDFLVRAAKKAEAPQAVELASAAFMAMPASEEAFTLLKSKATEAGEVERLEEAYKAVIAVSEELKDQAPHIRRLAKLYIEEIGNPEQALEWLKKLEPLGDEDDKKAIAQLAKGVQTRASQMPPPAAASTQPATVEDAPVEEESGAGVVAPPPLEEADSDKTPIPEGMPEATPDLPSTAAPPPIAPAPREAPPEPPDGMSNEEYVKLLHKDADKARRSGDDATAEERMLDVLDYAPQDQKAMTYLERRFRARSDWLSLRDLLLRSHGASHLPETVQTVRLREAARISEEQLGDTDGAITAWKIIRENNPSLRDAGDALSRLLSQAGRWQELLEIVEQEAETTKSRTKRIDAYRRIADINRVRLGNSEAATVAFKKVLELSPDDESALEALDEMYLRDQNYEDLVELLRKRADLTRDRQAKRDFHVRSLLALRERLDRPEDAYELAKEILTISPNDGEVLEIMESIDEEGEHWGRLLNTLDLRVRAIEDPSDKAHLLRKKSAIAIDRFQDTEAAVKALQEVLGVIPDDFQAMDQLSEIYTNSGQWEELVEVHRKRLEAEKEEHARAEVLREIARLLENNLDRPDEALESWRQVIEIEEDVESLGALLRFYERSGDWSEYAEVLARQAPYAEDYKERADILFKRAEVLYEKLASKDEAIEGLKKIIAEVDPTNLATLELLRKVYVEDNDYASAADLLDQQIENTEDAEKKKSLLVLAGDWARTELDDLGRASSAYESASAIDQEDAQLLKNLDEVYTSLESWEKLLTLLEQQFKVEPDEEEKLDILIRAAGICEEKLEDSKRAWDWYRVAFNSLRHLERTIDVVDEAARRLGLWQELVDEVYGALTRSAADVDEQVEWWLKIATVFEEKLDDVSQGLEAVLRAFGLAPENEVLLDKVDHLAVLAKNWQRLSTVYSVLVSRTEIKEDKIELLIRYAKLLAEQEEQTSQGFDISLKAFELEPTSDDLLEVVETIGEKAERWDDMVRVYNVCLRFAEADDKKADLMLRSIKILRDKKEDPDGAMQQILSLLRVDPFNENISSQVWDEIKALEEDLIPSQKSVYWNQFIETLRALAEENRKDRVRQAELISVVARVYAEELDDVATAFESLKEIQQLNPRDEEAISRLEELAKEHNYWEAVTDHYRDVLDETFEMEIAVMFHKRLARILEEELGLPEEASEHYWQIIQLDVSDMNGYEKLLDYYTNAEKWNELVNLLERQLDNTKQDEDKKAILLKIAAIWEDKIKNKYEAKDWYEQIITLWPDNEEAKEGIERLSVGGSTTENIEEEDADDEDDDINELISIPPPPAEEDAEAQPETVEDGLGDEESESDDDEMDGFSDAVDDAVKNADSLDDETEGDDVIDDAVDDDLPEEESSEEDSLDDDQPEDEPVDEDTDVEDEVPDSDSEEEEAADEMDFSDVLDVESGADEETALTGDLDDDEVADADDLVEEEAMDADDLVEEEAIDADDLVEEEAIDADELIEEEEMDLELDDDDLVLDEE